MMDMSVTVLMTVFNGEQYLAECMESILAQDSGEFEFLIIDDGSTDSTADVVGSFDDDRIRYVPLGRNQGRPKALNRGLAEASGELIAIIDADDIATPSRLRILKAAFETDDDLALVGSGFISISSRGEFIGETGCAADTRDIREVMPYSNPIAHSGVMYRRDMALACGGYPEDFPYAHDMMLYIEMMRAGHGLRLLEDRLVSIREHGAQMTIRPELEFARRDDMARSFHAARNLNGVSRDANAQGLRAEVYCGLRSVRALWAASPLKGLRCFMGYALRYPYHVLRAYFVNPDLRRSA